ncbi:MAG: hypothetical protein U1E05_02160 [Patescibacteria group bacterium]|nr:hypothetical protein [Patescibacteria group bacterium]
MSLIDWLRKLGILRFGAEGAVYHNAKDRPLSMQQPGVFNSEKDVVHFGKKAEAGDAPKGDK